VKTMCSHPAPQTPFHPLRELTRPLLGHKPGGPLLALTPWMIRC